MPMNRELYPSNWKDIALKIKTEANWICEHCKRLCRRPGESVEQLSKRLGKSIPHPQQYCLTVAHLDHRPENCDRSNLRALCAPCHCRYDLSQMGTKQRLKRERKGQLALSFVPDLEPYSIENPEIIATSSGTAKVTRTETIDQSQIIWADYGSGQEHPHQPEDVKVIHPPEQWQVGDKAIFNLTNPPGHIVILTVLEVEETQLRVKNPIGTQWTELIQNLKRIDVTGCEDAQFVSDLPELKYTTPPLPLPTTTDSVEVQGDRPNSNTKSSARKRYPKRGKASGWLETRTANPKRKKPNQYQVYRWESEGKRYSRSLRRAIAPVVEQMINEGEPWRAIVERIEESRQSL